MVSETLVEDGSQQPIGIGYLQHTEQQSREIVPDYRSISNQLTSWRPFPSARSESTALYSFLSVAHLLQHASVVDNSVDTAFLTALLP